ncbi:MAG TPA: RecX family transcriptional regulator, partial [Myxococcales bacterium]|nr:RecX family transcriptional regulator [Myxococcales bacterium]
KALRLLAARQRTELELRKALQSFAPAEVDSALARVKELGYINDRETARARARTRVGQGEAPRLAARKLSAQGIAAADARDAASEAAEGAGEEELAARALYRRLRGRKPASEREKLRLLRALIAKGHRPSVAARALGMTWEGDDDLEET